MESSQRKGQSNKTNNASGQHNTRTRDQSSREMSSFMVRISLRPKTEHDNESWKPCRNPPDTSRFACAVGRFIANVAEARHQPPENPNAMKLLLLSVVLLLGGCSTVAQYEDVSAVSPYHAYIGAEYALLQPMHFSGVNAPPGYEDTVDYYVVNPTSPSWGGPELITRETLPTGTRIKVEAVRICTNCPFERISEARIRLLDHRTEFDRPVHIALKFLTPGFTQKQP